MAFMIFFRTDKLSQSSLILLVLLALVIVPFVNAGASVVSFSAAAGKCRQMQKMDMGQSQSTGLVCPNQKNNACKAHCQNLLLSYLPLSIPLESFAFQVRSMRPIQLSSSQVMRGIFLPLDPRPPQS